MEKHFFTSDQILLYKKKRNYEPMVILLKCSKKKYSGEGRYKKRLLYRMSAIECRKNDKIM